MNALDSPLEALAFNYLSYGLLTAVNNVWMWVALMTAAVSFWRIRASSEHPRGKILDGSSQSRVISPPVQRTVVAEPAQLPDVISVAEPVHNILFPETVQFINVGLSSFTDTEGTTKGSMVDVVLGSFTDKCATKAKLTLYYCNEKESEKCGGTCNEGEVDGNDDNGDKIGEEWWSKWEMVMKMRKGEDEWYRYQDFTAINGSVVRLWDGGL
ncbi:hypothetical protein Leryth_007344 [Lithospermum erythrorhizon]|nr:hypothetical protein Leryth_007344 [Lithospermum erythrorhizon]